MSCEQIVASVMRRCKNYFDREVASGTFNIAGGVLSPTLDCDWVYIKGSKKNDGVHDLTACPLRDESFEGTVWCLYPTREFLALCEDIGQFTAENAHTGVVSESFGNYSHTDATGVTGGKLTWQEAFAIDLQPYVRMFTGVG